MDSHDPHHLRDACQTDGPLLFYHDSLVEPPYVIQSCSHFSILTQLFNGVISRRVDSHTIVSAKHMSNLLNILIRVFLSQPPTCLCSSSLAEYFLADDKLTLITLSGVSLS